MTEIENRTKQVAIYLTETEHRNLRERAFRTGQTPAALARGLVLDHLDAHPAENHADTGDDFADFIPLLRLWAGGRVRTLRPSDVLKDPLLWSSVPNCGTTNRPPSPAQLGQWLTRLCGRRVGGHVVSRVKHTRSGNWAYRVDKV